MLRDDALLVEALIQYCESQLKTGNLASSSNRAIWLVCGRILEGRTWKINVTHLKLLCCLGNRIRWWMRYCKMWEMLSCTTLCTERKGGQGKKQNFSCAPVVSIISLGKHSQKDPLGHPKSPHPTYITHFKTSSSYLYTEHINFCLTKA